MLNRWVCCWSFHVHEPFLFFPLLVELLSYRTTPLWQANNLIPARCLWDWPHADRPNNTKKIMHEIKKQLRHFCDLFAKDRLERQRRITRECEWMHAEERLTLPSNQNQTVGRQQQWHILAKSHIIYLRCCCCLNRIIFFMWTTTSAFIFGVYPPPTEMRYTMLSDRILCSTYYT